MTTTWTTKDFEVYRENYGVMLDLLYQNPVISNILNNVARPSQLEGYAKTMIDALRNNVPLLMENFVALIESEFVFVATHKEPFVFLRERSRIAARATGDYVNELMKPVVVKHFRSIVDECYGMKIRNSQNVQEMTDLNNRILKIVYSDEFINDIPLQVKFIVKQIFSGANRFGFSNYNYMLTGNMLFLRCICPMISVPEYYGTNTPSKGAPSQPARKCLVLQGKLLSNIGNFSQGHQFELDEQLIQYKKHITGNAEAYRRWVDKIMSADFSSYHFKTTARHDENFQAVHIEPDSSLSDSSSVNQSGNLQFVTPKVIKEEPKKGSDNEPERANVNLTPQEIIRNKLIKEYNLGTNSKSYPLRYLACIHHAFKEHKQHIYDVIQAMHSQETEYTSSFPNQAHEQKFKRLIEQYARLSYIGSTRLVNLINQMLQLLQQPPPISGEIDYRPYDPKTAEPKFYDVIKVNYVGKQQKRVVKFTTCSLLNIEGNLKLANMSSGKKVSKFSAPSIKNEITGNEIVSITINDKEPTVALLVNTNDVNNKEDDKKRTYICDNMLMRDQILGEVFEMCYWKTSKLLTYFAQTEKDQVVLKLTKDSLLKIKDNKIMADYHLIRLTYLVEGTTITFTFDLEDAPITETFTLRCQDDVLSLTENLEQLMSIYKPDNEPDIDKM